MNKKDIAKHYISTECKIKLAIKKMGNLNVNNFCLVLGKQKNILGTITDGDIRRGLLKNYNINEKVEKKFLKKAFVKFGAVAIPMHMAMWNISFNLANKFNIPYIFWGENSANEYGGSKQDLKLKNLNQEWIKKYGINFGTNPSDWIDKDLTKKDLAPFIKDKVNKNTKYPKSIFLGDYYFWDPEKTFHVAAKYGFKNHKNKAKTGIYDYADIDDDLISIHHFLKIYKFGFSRVQDNLSLEIRNGRINRSKAIKIVKKSAFKIPHSDINKFCNFIGINNPVCCLF